MSILDFAQVYENYPRAVETRNGEISRTVQSTPIIRVYCNSRKVFTKLGTREAVNMTLDWFDNPDGCKAMAEGNYSHPHVGRWFVEVHPHTIEQDPTYCFGRNGGKGKDIFSLLMEIKQSSQYRHQERLRYRIADWVDLHQFSEVWDEVLESCKATS